jgi:hypothetical protein
MAKNAEDRQLAKFEQGDKKPPEFKGSISSPIRACHNSSTGYKSSKKWHGTCHTPANALAGAAMDLYVRAATKTKRPNHKTS